MRNADFTLSAGPTAIGAPVLAAMGAPMCYHYDPAFVEQYRRTERKVGVVMAAERADALLMHGEAVLGLEAAWRAVVRPGMHCLNLVSGVFGEGMGAWLRTSQGVVHEVVVGYDDAIDPADVERSFRAHPEIELVTVVYSETPSGTLNPVAEIARIAKEHGAITLVDCVSAVGGMPFEADQWDLDICVAGAQKCLAGPPGITLITVSADAWAVIARNPTAPRGSYLSLVDWKERWLGEGRFPFTPSVVEVRAVEAACDAFLAEGRQAVFARHALAARTCRQGVRAMGLDLWPKRDEIMSPCVTAVRLPEGLSDSAVREHAMRWYGVALSGGHGAGNLVRIGHMGETARSLFPVVGLAALGRTLADLGASVDIGPGLEAGLQVLSGAGEHPSG